VSWPVATVVIVVTLCLWGLIATWINVPRFEKRVGDLTIKLRGEEARVAIQHYCSAMVLGVERALDGVDSTSVDRASNSSAKR